MLCRSCDMSVICLCLLATCPSVCLRGPASLRHSPWVLYCAGSQDIHCSSGAPHNQGAARVSLPSASRGLINEGPMSPRAVPPPVRPVIPTAPSAGFQPQVTQGFSLSAPSLAIASGWGDGDAWQDISLGPKRSCVLHGCLVRYLGHAPMQACR
ncbi:hypothetical protein NDU88_002546 [Pleurodeles waltl]|uniref:Secreted protein n=1 Tax=Pleurodeles waltl TaxID=8319 RepID=A0AAV7UY16_PLEWA|nr:hypothetical protein NDU88_002546 [Pleurodeles waltl]